MSIFIFSRPIHSGKTTELLQWCIHQQNIHGVLMPDISGSRKIFDIHTTQVFDIECKDAATNTEPLTTVGRFNFYTRAFENANSILLHALAYKPNWLVIDEAGILELEEKGLYDGIMKAVEHYSHKEAFGNLLVTVRESLCEEVISFFKIRNCRVIHQLQQL